MDYNTLYSNIVNKGSFLTIGLDPTRELLPSQFASSKYPLFDFNREIIDATSDLAVAYKPNLAFYEAEGPLGWRQFEMTVEYIRRRDPSLFIIADAKRGDIGNTAQRYASYYFDRVGCDAVTLSPYMGEDSIAPFLKYSGRWVIILALTSNPSAEDFETNSVVAKKDGLKNSVQSPLYERVVRRAMEWGSSENTMFVVGATRSQQLGEIREIAPSHFFLVPGGGAQGGSLQEVIKEGMGERCSLLINSSREIIYAWRGADAQGGERQFAAESARVAKSFLSTMGESLKRLQQRSQEL